MYRNVNNARVMSDEEIIELFWNRNQTAIRETDIKYGKYIYSLQFNILNDSEDAKECCNDTYLKLWNRIPPTRPNVFIAFITVIARNIAVDRYKEKKAKKRVPPELTVAFDEMTEIIDTEDTINKKIESDSIKNTLNRFLADESEQNRHIFVLRYYYLDSVKNISDMLGLNERTVFLTLSSMRKRLKKLLEQENNIS